MALTLRSLPVTNSNRNNCQRLTMPNALGIFLVCTTVSSVGVTAEPANPAKSLLANGNFETATKDQWPDHWPRPKVGGGWVEENGNHFLRLTATEPGMTILLYRNVNIPSDGRALKLSWRQRVTDLKPGKQPWF